jgi:hypothetical protein
MTEILDNILIFKTNIRTLLDKENVGRILDSLAFIEEWNVDLEDVDCVLRIVSKDTDPKKVINNITKAGYECCELD